MGRLKKALLLLFAAAMFLLCACGKKALSWQEQYDLGVRYLSDGNYQEAVIAFEAAIMIDAKRSESYLGAAEAYIAIGDIEAARNILEKGLEATGDQDIAARLQELLDGSEFDINALFTTALQGKNVISYANIPELFSREYDDLASFFDLPLYDQYETTSTGNFNGHDFSFEANGCYYGTDYGSTLSGSSVAALNSREIIDAGMSASLTEDGGTPTGWLDICFGDDYGAVLQKLGMDISLTDKLIDYKGIWIELYEDGRKSGYALEQSGTTMNGQPLPQITIEFYSEMLDEEKIVWMEFSDGSHLDRILYRNQSLFKTIVSQ